MGVNGSSTYLQDIKDFIVDNYAVHLTDKSDRQAFIEEVLPHEFQADIDWSGTPKTFVYNLVNTLQNKKINNKYAIINILEYLKSKIDIDYYKQIDSLQVSVIEDNKDYDQFYVCVIVNCDPLSYMPIRCNGIDKFSGLAEEIIRVNKARTKPRPGGGKKRIQYPYFNLHPWICYTCADLQNWNEITSNFFRRNFLAILVDSSVFNGQTDRPCIKELARIMDHAGSHFADIGIACIKNYQVQLISLRIFRFTLRRLLLT